MKYLTLLITVLLYAIKADTCPISPFYQVATEPKKYAEKSNMVFFGKLCNIDNLSDSKQIAEFQVLETFKGNSKTKIRIVNNIETDCSRMFRDIGTDYYVFGNLENTGEEIVMNGFPSFVPELYAIELGMLDKLGAAKPHKGDTEDKSTCLPSDF